MTTKITNEEIRAALNRASNLPTTASGGFGDAPPKTQKRIHIDKIYRYEGNPRKASNDKFLEIKESIRNVGLKQLFDVTQRPADVSAGLYVQASGGGTRLEALKALYAEDKAAGVERSKYEYVFCMQHPYVDELTIEAAHLVENMQRSQMNYWDSAVGMMRFKASIEAQLGEPLSLKAMANETVKLGMGLSSETLNLYYFGVTYMNELGSHATNLSATKVAEVLRPNYLSAMRLATRGHASGAGEVLDDDAFKTTIADPALRAYATELGEDGVFDAATLAKRLEQAVADAMGFDAKQFTSLATLAKSHSGVSLAELVGKDVKTLPLLPPNLAPDPESGTNASKPKPSSPSWNDRTLDDDDDGDGDGDGDGVEPPSGDATNSNEFDPHSVPRFVPNRVPNSPHERIDRNEASGQMGTMTDAQMALAQQQAQLQQSTLATTIAATIAAMTTANRASSDAAQAMQAAHYAALGTAPNTTLPTSANTPLLSLSGNESPFEILERMQLSIGERVRAIADAYGIAACVVDAPLLPLGYTMDLPAMPFSPSPAAQCWWFLSYVSTLNTKDVQGVNHYAACLPMVPSEDGGEPEPLALSEFLAYLVNNEYDEAQSLIGVVHESDELGIFAWALFFPIAPCSDELMQLMQLVRLVNQFQPGLLRHPCLPIGTPTASVADVLLRGMAAMPAHYGADQQGVRHEGVQHGA